MGSSVLRILYTVRPSFITNTSSIYSRFLVTHALAGPPEPDRVAMRQQVFSNELDAVLAATKKNPYSYTPWNHLMAVLDQASTYKGVSILCDILTDDLHAAVSQRIRDFIKVNISDTGAWNALHRICDISTRNRAIRLEAYASLLVQSCKLYPGHPALWSAVRASMASLYPISLDNTPAFNILSEYINNQYKDAFNSISSKSDIAADLEHSTKLVQWLEKFSVNL